MGIEGGVAQDSRHFVLLNTGYWATMDADHLQNSGTVDLLILFPRRGLKRSLEPLRCKFHLRLGGAFIAVKPVGLSDLFDILELVISITEMDVIIPTPDECIS